MAVLFLATPWSAESASAFGSFGKPGGSLPRADRAHGHGDHQQPDAGLESRVGAIGYDVYLDGGQPDYHSRHVVDLGNLACGTSHLLAGRRSRPRITRLPEGRGHGTTSACQARPPVSTGLPVVSGSVVEGQVLSGSSGSWSGSGPFSFAYQWLRCNGRGRVCGCVGGDGVELHVGFG